MFKRFLKGFAVSLGAALAFGIGTTLGKGSSSRRSFSAPDLSPIVDRLEGIEDRIHKVEAHLTSQPVPAVPQPVPAEGPSFSELEVRLVSQNSQLESLRHEIQLVESRSAAQVAAFSRKLSEVEARLPAEIEANVAERIAVLEHKLQADFRQTHSRTVDLFVQTIESKVVQRIAALEQNLAEHSQTIVSLREKSLSTDENLQKLLAAVERLCSQTLGPGPSGPGSGSASGEPKPAQPAAAPASLPSASPLPVASFSEHFQAEVSKHSSVAIPRIPEPAAFASRPNHFSIALPLVAIAAGILGLRFSK